MHIYTCKVICLAMLSYHWWTEEVEVEVDDTSVITQEKILQRMVTLGFLLFSESEEDPFMALLVLRLFSYLRYGTFNKS